MELSCYNAISERVSQKTMSRKILIKKILEYSDLYKVRELMLFSDNELENIKKALFLDIRKKVYPEIKNNSKTL